MMGVQRREGIPMDQKKRWRASLEESWRSHEATRLVSVFAVAWRAGTAARIPELPSGIRCKRSNAI